MPNLMVEKKDGTQEPFDRNKIVNGLLKSGATDAEAQNLATQVETWAQGAAANGVVKSLAIRTKILELLRIANAIAAQAFETYRKPA